MSDKIIPISADTVLDNRDYKELYFDLIFEVGIKHPDETRHETAKRYIQQAEQFSGVGSCQAQEPE